MNQINNNYTKEMVDFFNFYLAKGPLSAITDQEDLFIKWLGALSDDETVMRYRQQLGGIFTSLKQVMDMPGMTSQMMAAIEKLMNVLDLERLEILTPKTTYGNQVDAFVNGPDCLEMILEEINQAKHYIHLSVMLFFNDQAGNAIANALLQALSRGVQVRMMVDYGVTQIGYDHLDGVGDFQRIADKIKAAGGETINCFHVCYKTMDWEKKRADLKAQRVPEGILFLQDCVQTEITNGLNVVNHRKFIIIDGITSILGSLNFGDQYLYTTPIFAYENKLVDGRLLGVPSEEGQWHDGCFRIRGALALPLNELFASQWIVLGGDIYDPKSSFYYPDMDRACGNEECTLFSSFPGSPVNLIQQYYLALISYASSEVVIVNPYMIDQVFWNTLQNLEAQQSTHISLCNPLLVSDHLTNQSAVRGNMYKPFLNGVSYYDYSKTGRFSHWKIAYDKQADSVFHGSYNLNTRSASHDFEVGLLVKSKPFADKVKAIIAYDLNHSEKITDAKAFHKYPHLHPSYYLNDLTKYFS
jgi:cardiolipin synthase